MASAEAVPAADVAKTRFSSLPSILQKNSLLAAPEPTTSEITFAALSVAFACRVY